MAMKIIRICDVCGAEHEQIDSMYSISEIPVDFTCSDCILKIEQLADLNANTNNGRGILTVRDIISCLRSGKVETAKIVYGIDGDKIQPYRNLQNKIESILGCRLHCVKNCQDKLCKAIREHNEIRIAIKG